MSVASDRGGMPDDLMRHRAESARRIVIPQWARWLEDTLDDLALSFNRTTRKGQAIRRAIDVMHELQKSYGSGWEADRETRVQAQIIETLEDLAGVGLGTIELDMALERAMAERWRRSGASAPERGLARSGSQRARSSKSRAAK